MLETGKFYKGEIIGRSYRCLEIKGGVATLWVYVELPPNTFFPLAQKDGTQKMIDTFGEEYTQDLKYQDQYKLITDSIENARLLRIYNIQHHIRKPLFPIKEITGLTDMKFNQIMDEIDEELKFENSRIPGRELRAIPKIAQKLNIDNLPLTCENNKLKPNFYTTENISTHVIIWFKNKYGNKLNIKTNNACMILDIKDTYFKVDFPIIFGKVTMIFDNPLKNFNNMGQNGNKTIVNVSAHIKDLTPALFNSLTDKEKDSILTLYGTTSQSISKYQEIKFPFQQEALTDLEAAVDSFFYAHQQYGQSKWESLQFVEKLFKGLLLRAEPNTKTPHTHSLNELAEKVLKTAGITLDAETIKKIQCSPSVRYSTELVSEKEALIAHHASLEILRSVIRQI